MTEVTSLQDFLDLFEERRAKIEALSNDGWVVGWPYALFIKVRPDDYPETTGLERATVFATATEAKKHNVWNGKNEKASVYTMSAAKSMSLAELDKSIIFIRERMAAKEG